MRQTVQPRVPVRGKEASKPLTEKPVGVEMAGETLRLTGEFVGEIHMLLEHTQNHPPRNQHQKGPICLWVLAEVTESWPRAQKVALFLLAPTTTNIHCHKAETCVASP